MKYIKINCTECNPYRDIYFGEISGKVDEDVTKENLYQHVFIFTHTIMSHIALDVQNLCS